MKSLPTVLYFGMNPPEKSARDAPYIAGLRDKGVTILECVDSAPRFGKYWNLIRKHWALRHSYDVLFVGHTSTYVVPLARLISRKPIVFNALNPFYDSLVLEWEMYKPYSFGAMFVWVIDFLSLNCATVVLLETNEQIKNVHRTFFVPLRKLVRVWTTNDPQLYAPDQTVQKNKQFLCVYRGNPTPVTGAEYIVEAARLLRDEDISFRFITRGKLVQRLEQMARDYNLHNIEFLTEYYSFEKLRKLILEGHVLLGQFSTHARLDRTIQFKTVEALAFGMAYITSDLPSNQELLHDGVDCLLVRRGDPRDLADKILLLKKDPALQQQLSEAAYALYQKELAPPVLAEQILQLFLRLL